MSIWVLLGLINGTESYFVYNEERWGYKIWKPGPKIHPEGDLSDRERTSNNWPYCGFTINLKRKMQSNFTGPVVKLR